MIILNPIRITGVIRSYTPKCVILEIAKSLGISYDKSKLEYVSYIQNIVSSIEEIHEAKISSIEVKKEYTNEELALIARFVNPSVRWKKSQLITAFNHLLTFYDVHIPPLPTSEWKEGSKTVDDPLAYNGIMLYVLCNYYSIPVDRDTSLEKMAYCIRLINEETSTLRGNLQSIISILPKQSLIALLTSSLTHVTPNSRKIESIYKCEEKKSLSSINSNSIDVNILIDTHKNLLDSSSLSRINPISQYETIILAAIVYGINLCECKNPHKEYMEMRRHDGSTINQYIPIDPQFNKRYLRNPSYFDVKKTYAYKIPSIYTTEDVTRFARSEGYDDLHFRDNSPLSCLHMSRILATFHQGYHPDTENTKTIISLEELADVNPKKIITYGIIDTKELTAYTIDELVDSMKATKSFIIPNNPNEKFSEHALKKLKNICKSYLPISRNAYDRVDGIELIFSRIVPPLNEISMGYKILLDTIIMVEQYDVAISDYANKFRSTYMKSSQKEKIIICLKNLLDCAAYMRSWKVGSDELPITSDQCSYDSSRQAEVDLNVTTAINTYKNSIPSQYEDLFYDLPLMKIIRIDGNIKFQASTSNDDGLTVNDRLEIVKNGNDSRSCIRTSSNYFMASVYYYFIAIDQPPPFNIHNLAIIS